MKKGVAKRIEVSKIKYKSNLASRLLLPRALVSLVQVRDWTSLWTTRQLLSTSFKRLSHFWCSPCLIPWRHDSLHSYDHLDLFNRENSLHSFSAGFSAQRESFAPLSPTFHSPRIGPPSSFTLYCITNRSNRSKFTEWRTGVPTPAVLRERTQILEGGMFLVSMTATGPWRRHMTNQIPRRPIRFVHPSVKLSWRWNVLSPCLVNSPKPRSWERLTNMSFSLHP